MKRPLIFTGAISIILLMISSPISLAGVTASPSQVMKGAQGSATPLTPQMKSIIQEAKAILTSSIVTAKSAYGLLIADAKANRDQLLATANKDAAAIEAAKAKFRSDLVVANAFLSDQLIRAKKTYAETLSKSGITLTK